jgi:hypothetical protein
MKRIIISLLMISVLMLNAQTDNLPQKVNDAFYGKYPKARDLIWKIDNNIYEIEFYQSGDMFTALFDKDGNWIETGVVIADGELPVNFKQELNKKYADAEIIYSEKVVTSNNISFFRVFIETPDTSLIIKSSPDGKISEVKQDNN